MVRQWIPNSTMPGDADKAAREIYKIANDADVALHVPVGLDAIEGALTKVKALTADVEKARPFSSDLKLAA
jgi:hypothetical protein